MGSRRCCCCRPASGTSRCSSLPILIVVVYSFGTRGADGGYAPGFTLDNYAIVFDRPQPFVTSLFLAVSGTALCLLVAFPLAYFIASRAGKRKGLFIILLVIPFWTSFLIRTISWLVILGPRGRRRVPRGPDRGRHPDPRHADGDPHRHRLQLPAADGVPAVRDAGAARPDAARGVQGPRRRPLGDVPPDHAADRLAGRDHRQHPRVHPADGRVRRSRRSSATARCS